MKKLLSMILMMTLVLSLFSACGNKNQIETGAPSQVMTEEDTIAESESNNEGASVEGTSIDQAPEFDLLEKSNVDDSYTYEWEYGEGPESDPFRYFRDIVAQQYVDTWMENGEILDLKMNAGSGMGHTYLEGWILFTGTPKQETGWNTVTYHEKPAYCRSFQILGTEEGTFTAKKSHAAIPIPYLKEDLFRKQYKDLDFIIAMNQSITLPELQEAQLYCQENGQVYQLTDFGSLSELSRALKPAKFYEPHIESGIPWDTQATDINHLILTFQDGTRAQLLTAGDGSNLVSGWMIGEMLQIPESLYELFSVPLNASGYEIDEEGCTLARATALDYDYVGPDLKQIAWEQVLTFSPEGNLIQTDLRKSADGEILSHRITEITYTPEGRISRVTINENGENQATRDYLWNENGTLQMETETFRGGPSLDTKYQYDEGNRIIAVIRYDEEGKEFGPTSQSYYWYDEEGIRYYYQYGPDGSVVSGTAPDTPIRKKND